MSSLLVLSPSEKHVLIMMVQLVGASDVIRHGRLLSPSDLADWVNGSQVLPLLLVQGLAAKRMRPHSFCTGHRLPTVPNSASSLGKSSKSRKSGARIVSSLAMLFVKLVIPSCRAGKTRLDWLRRQLDSTAADTSPSRSATECYGPSSTSCQPVILRLLSLFSRALRQPNSTAVGQKCLEDD